MKNSEVETWLEYCYLSHSYSYRCYKMHLKFGNVMLKNKTA